MPLKCGERVPFGSVLLGETFGTGRVLEKSEYENTENKFER
jgi:hypothetical protein